MTAPVAATVGERMAYLEGVRDVQQAQLEALRAGRGGQPTQAAPESAPPARSRTRGVVAKALKYGGVALAIPTGGWSLLATAKGMHMDHQDRRQGYAPNNQAPGRVANGGTRHGSEGALSRWAGKNKSPLVAGTGLGVAALATGAALLPAAAIGAAAFGIAKLVRNRLRARRENQEYQANVEQLRNSSRREEQSPVVASPDINAVPARADDVAAERPSLRERVEQRAQDRLRERGFGAGAAQPQGGRHRTRAGAVSVAELSQRSDVVTPAAGTPVPTVRSAVAQGDLANPLRRQGGAVIGAVAAPGSYATVSNRVPAVGPVDQLAQQRAKRAARLAEQTAEPATNAAVPVKQPPRHRSLAASGMPGRVSPGVPRTAAPVASRGGAGTRVA